MSNPSSLEILLLVMLLTASFGAFLRRFQPVLEKIFASKRDPAFSLSPISRRVRDFVWEVLLQGKVIRERPLPGLAHAFVFWGFCVFALVTVNHLAAGFGLGFLQRSSILGTAYFTFAALFAVAVTLSIIGLFVRRFILRPKWLGEHVSIESGWIALLIFLLMTTYLISFWYGESKLLWWAHTLPLLIFLPLVPHTKHLHLILSPFSVFLSRGGFAQIPPLSGDEDFGLVTGQDITQLVALQAYSCVECGRCTEHCPANNTGKLLDPKGIALGFRGYLNELGPASEEPLLGVHLSQEAAFQCTTCGACEYQCPVGVEHLPMIIGLRRGAVNTGQWEDDRGTKLFLALERNGNALGFSPSEREKFIAKEQFPVFDGTQEYCLWLGCMGAYDPRGREIISAFAQVMTHLGASFGVLKKEKCTGDPARRLGNDLVFQQLAEANLEMLDKEKVRKIVSICPHCVRTISNDWKEYAKLHVAPEIEHHSEFMARHQAELQAKQTTPASDEKIAYHDPCYLGRYRNVYDEPRQVIALAGSVVDPPRNRERGFCCGAGGGLAFLGEESGERVSHNRAKELTATGAKTVAAACPFCQTMLRDGLSAVSDAPPKLFDIAEIALVQLQPPA
ncbi:MAG: (Fe-S)-binding protein [Acidobacteriota bacterium]